MKRLNLLKKATTFLIQIEEYLSCPITNMAIIQALLLALFSASRLGGFAETFSFFLFALEFLKCFVEFLKNCPSFSSKQTLDKFWMHVLKV